MAIALVAALIVLLVLTLWPGNVEGLRKFGWYRAWLGSLAFAEGGGRVALALVLPVLVCAVVQHFIAGWFYALAGLVFAVLMLFYTFGPRELEHDFEAVLHEPDPAARVAAAEHLRSVPDGAPRAFTAAELVEAAVLASLRRRFGVLFWFFLLGPAGALGYRMAWETALTDDPRVDPRTRHAARRFADALDWIPAHLMVFALALVSNFDAVIGAWRRWHRAVPRAAWEPNPDFLITVARSGVDADLTADAGVVAAARDPVAELADSRRLMLRVLVVWLAVVALIVLAGWVD
ncbi:MAG TPA: regulatory signaling modulator protein AmpE [Rhodanobacteraceae bacterium]|nr:regulatory signaling modulator protein AmpE [Rhodanobacteraceae bacterium]